MLYYSLQSCVDEVKESFASDRSGNWAGPIVRKGLYYLNIVMVSGKLSFILSCFLYESHNQNHTRGKQKKIGDWFWSVFSIQWR